MAFRETVRVLRHRNFRLFIIGQGISLIGTWMDQIAMSWQVYSLSRDTEAGHPGGAALALGFVAFAGQAPALLLAPVAGVLADRLNRRRLLIITQTCMMLQAATIATLTLTGGITVPWIMALGLVLGILNAFDMPTRQAFLGEMVTDRHDLTHAIGLNASIFNAARLVGPAAAAGLLALFGAGVCFIINAISYLAVIVALLAMHIPPRAIPPQTMSLFTDLRAGFVYSFGFPPIRLLLILVSLVSMASASLSVLLPLIATHVLQGSAGTFGALSVSSALGALGAALYLASRKTVVGLGRWLVFALCLLGCGLLTISASPPRALAMAALTVCGFGTVLHFGSSNMLLQTIADDDRRGRVLSLYTMAFLGMAPIGSLTAGWWASHFGAEHTLRWSGAVCLVAAAVLVRRLPTIRALVRPIYIQRGILPETAGEVLPMIEAPGPALAVPGEKLAKEVEEQKRRE